MGTILWATITPLYVIGVGAVGAVIYWRQNGKEYGVDPGIMAAIVWPVWIVGLLVYVWLEHTDRVKKFNAELERTRELESAEQRLRIALAEKELGIHAPKTQDTEEFLEHMKAELQPQSKSKRKWRK